MRLRPARLSLAVGLLSGAALAYQILLMRLFSIVQWHHFAYMVISLALLGYGASGALLTLFRRQLLDRFRTAFALFAALFGLLGPACFCLAQRMRLNPLEMIWEPRQLGAIGAVYLLLALPFLCAGTAIGLALARFERSAHRIYRADLVGAALGAMGAIGALYLWAPATGLRMVGAAGGLAAILGWTARDRRRPGAGDEAATGPRAGRATAALASGAVLLAVLWPAGWLEPRMSEYKALSKVLAVPGTEVVAERSSPLGALAVVASPRIPFRMAPGLSLAFSGELPEQRLILRDGEVAAVVDGADPGGAPPGYLRYLPAALPFELFERAGGRSGPGAALPGPGVAVLGAGSGTGLALALAYGAAEIHAVEVDPRLLELWTGELAAFAARPYDDPRLRRHAIDPRGFLGSTRRSFDLILMPPVGGGTATGTADSMGESYVHTVEALALAIGASSDHGLVAIEGEITAPPRVSLKLVAAAAAALERWDLDPRRHLAAIRSWSRFVVVIKRSAFDPRDVASLRAFCREREFDLAYYPGMAAAEANRFHLLDEPELFRGIAALLGPSRAEFIRGYKFDIRPTTDDRPYPLHFFRWRTLGELVRLRTTGGAALLDWGYLVVVATLLQAALAGLVLILLPLWWLRRRSPAAGAGRAGLYFLCLGLAFLLLEIAFIQRLTLFLAHPLLAAGVVLAGFLLFAGLGSGASRRLEELWPRAPIPSVAAAIVALALAELGLLGWLFERGSAWPLALKLPAALGAIAPLAFLLGMPFPLGLRRLAASRGDLVPWAWGVNGWASVLAAVLATLLAVHFGFTAVVLSACALYLVAAATPP